MKVITKYSLLMTLARATANLLSPEAPAEARERSKAKSSQNDGVERDEQGRRVVYKKKNVVDFDAMLLEGDLKNPNEFYFVHRPQENFGSLVKKRKNFHKEMLRDAVMTR